MVKELVAIKVKIGLHPDGTAKYPDFNSLNAVKHSPFDDWAVYIDRVGTGWLYDKCGHQEEENGSPKGQQWAMTLVPETFAKEAVETFAEVTWLSEAEAEEFYDKKFARRVSQDRVNQRVVDGIRAKEMAGIPLNDIDRAALDPDDDSEPGILRNPRKRFKTFKQAEDIKVKDPE